MGSNNVKMSKMEDQLVDHKVYTRETELPKDERYGEMVRIYKEVASAQRAAIITKVFDNPIAFEAKLEFQKIMTKLRHPGLVQLLNVVSKKKESLCSKMYKIKCLYDYAENDLAKDIDRRIKCQGYLKTIPFEQVHSSLELDESCAVHFDEHELWYILAASSAALGYLQQSGIFHGDIRPYNLCQTADGLIKIMSINSFIQTGWSSYMEQLEGLPTNSTYLSPTQLKALQHKIALPKHDIPKSDVFCLGVVILECCLLESAKDIYDFTTFTIDTFKRVQRIKELNKYSDAFIFTLSEMLELNENKRISPEQLYENIVKLAEEQEICISKNIYSLEKAVQFANQWRQKNQGALRNQGNSNQQVVSAGQQMVLLPENKNKNYDQSMNKEQNNDQHPNNFLTDDELPNSEEGEIINEIGLLDINNVHDQSDSFSIQHSEQDNHEHNSFRSKEGENPEDQKQKQHVNEAQNKHQNILTQNNNNPSQDDSKENQGDIQRNQSVTSVSNLDAQALKQRSLSQHFTGSGTAATPSLNQTAAPYGNSNGNRTLNSFLKQREDNSAIIQGQQQNQQTQQQFQGQRQGEFPVGQNPFSNNQLAKSAAQMFLAHKDHQNNQLNNLNNVNNNNYMNLNNGIDRNPLNQNPLLLQVAAAAMLQKNLNQPPPQAGNQILQALVQNDPSILQMLLAQQVQQQQQQQQMQQNHLNALLALVMNQQKQQQFQQPQQQQNQVYQQQQQMMMQTGVNSFGIQSNNSQANIQGNNAFNMNRGGVPAQIGNQQSGVFNAQNQQNAFNGVQSNYQRPQTGNNLDGQRNNASSDIFGIFNTKVPAAGQTQEVQKQGSSFPTGFFGQIGSGNTQGASASYQGTNQTEQQIFSGQFGGMKAEQKNQAAGMRNNKTRGTIF